MFSWRSTNFWWNIKNKSLFPICRRLHSGVRDSAERVFVNHNLVRHLLASCSPSGSSSYSSSASLTVGKENSVLIDFENDSTVASFATSTRLSKETTTKVASPATAVRHDAASRISSVGRRWPHSTGTRRTTKRTLTYINSNFSLGVRDEDGGLVMRPVGPVISRLVHGGPDGGEASDDSGPSRESSGNSPTATGASPDQSRGSEKRILHESSGEYLWPAPPPPASSSTAPQISSQDQPSYSSDRTIDEPLYRLSQTAW